MLDVFEKVLAEHGRPDHRTRFEHCGTMTREQYRRAAELGITCSLFVDHTYYWGDVLVESLFGERAHDWANARAALDAAWQLQSEHEVSSIEVGKHADLVVLSADPYTADLHRLKRTDVASSAAAPQTRYSTGVRGAAAHHRKAVVPARAPGIPVTCDCNRPPA